MKKKTLFTAILILALALSCVSFAESFLPPLSAARGLQSKAIKAKSLYVSPSALTLKLRGDDMIVFSTIKAKAKPLTASQQFEWTTSNPAVATVDQNGTVTAVGLGKAKIICATSDSSYLKRAVAVTVKQVKVKSIKLENSVYTVAPNTQTSVAHTVTPAYAYDSSLIWSSSNTAVATVDQNGLVTTKKLGSCYITCKNAASGEKAKAKFKVTRAASDVYYLSIGQQEYKSASRLVGCRMDADRFEATVKASTFGGSSKIEGKVIYDQTASQIKAALNSISSWGMDESDVTYFYYSGHGSGFTNYEGALVGIDYAGTSTMDSTLVKVSDIRTYLDKVPGTVIIVVDACYSGNFITKSVTGGDFLRPFVAEFSSNMGRKSLIADNELKDKYKIIAACQPDELSYMIGNNYGSVFTQFVTQAGGVWGADVGEITVKKKMAGDTNGDKIVSVKDIFTYSYQRILDFLNGLYGSDVSIVQRMMVWPTADDYPVFARLS